MHDLIIIGAGPGGIALAAEARAAGIDPSRTLILEKDTTHNLAIRQPIRSRSSIRSILSRSALDQIWASTRPGVTFLKNGRFTPVSSVSQVALPSNSSLQLACKDGLRDCIRERLSQRLQRLRKRVDK